MTEPFTIRLYVPNGNPDQILLVDRLNWTGLGIKFSRLHWEEVSKRHEFSKPGIYILFEDRESELPRLYIGLAENLHTRINQHAKLKDFWNWGVAFTSFNGTLNRGHLTWLEYALIQKARKTHRSLLELDNNQTPSEPNLSEADKADTQAFLKEILQILPLMNLRVFEEPKPIILTSGLQTDTSKDTIDTIVVPAHEEGFNRVFLGENCWWAIRIASHMLEKLKFIAAYQSSPISGVTHFAPIKLIEPFGNDGKYKIIFSEKATEIAKSLLATLLKEQCRGLGIQAYPNLRQQRLLWISN